MKCSWCGGKTNVKEFPVGTYHSGCLQAKRLVAREERQRKKFVDPYDKPLERVPVSKEQKLSNTINRKVSHDWKERSKESIERIIAKGTNRK